MRKMWSANEKEILIRLWHNTTKEEIGAMLPGRSLESIKIYAKRLGLKRDPGFTSNLKSKNVLGNKNPRYGKSGTYLGKKHSEEAKQKLRIAATGRPGLSGAKNPMYGKPGSMLHKIFSEEHRRRISEAKKEMYKNLSPQERARRIMILQEASRAHCMAKKETLPEKKVREILIRLKIEYEPQYPIGYYLCDFFLSPNKVIEVYGDYWHANPTKYSDINKLNKTQRSNVGRDKAKQTYLKNRGISLLIIWERDLKNIIFCEEKIKTFAEDNQGIVDA